MALQRRVGALLLLLAASRGVSAGKLIEITTRNFDAETSKENLLLVFYAPWCGHCKRLEPVLGQLAATDDPDYSVGRCDGTEHRVLAQRFNVRGYPSLFFVRSKAEVIPYEGNRGFKDIEHFLKRGHADAARLSFVKSPFGPLGRLKGLCVRAGLYALDTHAKLAVQIGEYPAMAVVAVMALAALIVVLVVPLLILA